MKKLLLPTLGLLLPMPGLAQECRPEVISQPRPEYPVSLRRAGIEGRIHFQIRVRPDGMVDEVQILGSPHPHLAQATTAAVQRWRFKPLDCMPPGATVQPSVRMRGAIQFKLEEAQEGGEGS